MMSKIFITGQPFRQTVAYVCEDLTRAEVLAVKGVRGHDLGLMEKDFERQRQWMRLEKQKPVFHGMLSFPHGEDPGNEKMVEIAGKYLEKIGMGNTQYAIVRHRDKAHVHLHIIANRVDNDGMVTGEGLIVERGIKAAQQLTQEYGLTPENGKNLEQTNLSALRETDAKRYRLYQVIKDNLPACRGLDDLEKRLMENGVTVRYKYDPASGERKGISFCIEKYCFKGSQVDKAYSVTGLERLLTLQQKERLRLDGDAEVRHKQDGVKRPEVQQGDAVHEEREDALNERQRLRIHL